jgi:hypothetical protein
MIDNSLLYYVFSILFLSLSFVLKNNKTDTEDSGVTKTSSINQQKLNYKKQINKG